MTLFGDLRDHGFFDGGFLDKNLLQFSCMGLIQVRTYLSRSYDCKCKQCSEILSSKVGWCRNNMGPILHSAQFI